MDRATLSHGRIHALQHPVTNSTCTAIPRNARDVVDRMVDAGWEGRRLMARNVVRAILNIVLAAAAAWLANFIVEKMFGPEELEA